MKFFIFAGRVHHFLKLSELHNRLIEKGHEGAFVIAQNAINIDPPSEFLIDSQPFVHMYDYLTHDFSYSATDEYIKGNSLHHVAPFWIMFSTREMAEVYHAFSRLLEVEKPDHIFILHENNFWTKIIAFLCKENGVPCHSFQEGILRHQDQSTLSKQSYAAEYSDHLFVWGESSKRAYTDAGVDPNKIIVSGPVHLDLWHRVVANTENREMLKIRTREYFGGDHKTPIVAFFPPLLNRYKGDFGKDLETLNEFLNSNGFLLVTKLHPMNNFARLPDDIKKYDDNDAMPLLAGSDVCLTQHSSIGAESLALGVPVIEFNLSNTPQLQSWHTEGIAPKVSSQKDLDIILKVARGAYAELPIDAMNKWVSENILVDGKQVSRVMECLELA